GADRQPEPAGAEAERGGRRAQHHRGARRPPAHDHLERQLRQERELVRERRDPFQHAVADHDRAHPQRADLLRWCRDAAQDSEEIERSQVKASTLNYYRSVLAGVSQVQSGKAAVESAQKALDATRAGFEVGTQTMVNVLLAIQTLTQAESTYSQSRHQLVLNRLLLKQSAGTASL